MACATLRAWCRCIPIIISDRIQLPFLHSLEWGRFSLRLPERAVINGSIDVVAYARSIPYHRVTQLRRALWDARPLLTFNASLDQMDQPDDAEPRFGPRGQPPAARDAVSALLGELAHARTCERPLLVRRLGSPPCVHGHSFGLKLKAEVPHVWVRYQCHGLFSIWRRPNASTSPTLISSTVLDVASWSSAERSVAPPPPPGAATRSMRLDCPRDRATGLCVTVECGRGGRNQLCLLPR